MLEISHLSAFIGGLLTFLAPCTLPLIPAFVGFLSTTKRSDEDRRSFDRMLFVNAVLFTLAFTSVFVCFGLASGALGRFLVTYRGLLSQAGGVIVVLLGLSLLGAFAFPNISFVQRLPKWIAPGRPLSAFLLGLLFALGWSPCLGPILGTILFLAGASGTAYSGAALLLTYSLGLALPFLLLAVFFGTAVRYVAWVARFLPVINGIGGAIFIAIGVLLIIGDFGLLNVWAERLLGDGWYSRLMERM